jgi:hypothetical protein
MKITTITLALSLMLILVCGYVFAGPKGIIVVRPLGAEISITIDGNFDDWPLDKFGDPSVQPLYPDGQISLTTEARGEYIIYDPDRAGFFNTGRGVVSEDDPNTDFEVNTYFAYDSNYLYILSIFIDDEISDAMDTSDFGSMPFLNDGQEFFFDLLNDSNDCIAGISFPTIDGEAPNLDDFQIGTALSIMIDPVLPYDQSGLGVSNGIIRSGDLDFVGSGDFSDGTYQDSLEATSGPDIAAKEVTDLRAAGAPNPAIADNTDTSFTGYTIEQRIPFSIMEGFDPGHSIGFTIFWRDVDEGASGGSIQFIDWAQSSTAGGCASADAEVTDIFFAPNWGALEFDASNPLSGVTDIDEWPIH